MAVTKSGYNVILKSLVEGKFFKIKLLYCSGQDDSFLIWAIMYNLWLSVWVLIFKILEIFSHVTLNIVVIPYFFKYNRIKFKHGYQFVLASS